MCTGAVADLICLTLSWSFPKGPFQLNLPQSDNMTQAQLRKNWSLFAEVLMAEAGEARVHHRAFSLSRFICFLCNGSLPGNSVSDCVHVQSVTELARRLPLNEKQMNLESEKARWWTRASPASAIKTSAKRLQFFLSWAWVMLSDALLNLPLL